MRKKKNNLIREEKIVKNIVIWSSNKQKNSKSMLDCEMINKKICQY